jgi:GABA permease
LLKTNKRGVPVPAVLLVTSGGFIAAFLAALFPKQIAFFLLNSAGAIAILVYLAIAFSHLIMRRKLDRAGDKEIDAQRIRMWLYPYLDIVAIVGMLAVLISMWFIKETQLQLVLTLGSVLVVFLLYLLVHWRKSTAWIVDASQTSKTWLSARSPQARRKRRLGSSESGA